MAAFSNYLEVALLNATLRGVAFVPPGSLYLALFINDPTDAGTGTELNANSYPGYVRQQINAAGAGFAAPATQVDGSTQSASAVSVDFPAATADWPQAVSHFGLFDAAVGGNLLYHGAVTPARTLIAGDNIRFPAGSLRIRLD